MASVALCLLAAACPGSSGPIASGPSASGGVNATSSSLPGRILLIARPSGNSIPSSAPSPSPSNSFGPMTPPELARLLNSKGIDCSGFARTTAGGDGGIDQGDCGTMPVVIELIQFSNHDAITGQLVPYLQNEFCGEAPSSR